MECIICGEYLAVKGEHLDPRDGQRCAWIRAIAERVEVLSSLALWSPPATPRPPRDWAIRVGDETTIVSTVKR